MGKNEIWADEPVDSDDYNVNEPAKSRLSSANQVTMRQSIRELADIEAGNTLYWDVIEVDGEKLAVIRDVVEE